jgi:exodeoxyribonuclease VII small subunit
MDKKELSYKEAFARLQELHDLITKDTLDVDELSTLCREAAVLIKICKDRLFKVDEEIREIIQNMQG